MNKMNRMVVWLGSMALTAVIVQAAETKTKSSAASPGAATNLFADTVVAKAKKFEIKRSEVEAFFAKYKATMASQGQTIPEDNRPAIQYDMLKGMVDRRVLADRATAADVDKAKIKSDEYLADIKKRMPSEDAFKRQLLADGMTLEEFQERVLEQAKIQEVLTREIRSKIVIKEELAKKYYQDNVAQFDQPEQVRASHVLIGTKDSATGQDLPDDKKKEKKALAEKVLARAKAGEDFAKLAKEFSDDPGSKNSGGEYTFPRGQMVPEFEKAAFELQTNKVSDLVTTQFGYHIIKLNEKLPARKLPFSEVSTNIINRLTANEVDKQIPDFLEKARKEAGVQILMSEPPAPKKS